MLIKKTTVTIAIPAYNEAANIGRLLQALLRQQTKTFLLKLILVVSDGSTDDTAAEVKKITSNKIRLIIQRRRQGLNFTQNRILKQAATDVLVLLNGDVCPKDKHFLENLIRPLVHDRHIGMTGARLECLAHNTLVGRALRQGHGLKETIFAKINGGNNVYHCHGQARALARRFYRNFHWPYDCPEDAYSYFACVARGFKFVFVPNAVAQFSLSANLADHFQQSRRFHHGQKLVEKYFNQTIVRAGYRLPGLLSLYYLLLVLFRHPLLVLHYLGIIIFVAVFGKSKFVDHSQFAVSRSTKTLPI